MAFIRQPSFAGGEFSPTLWSRTDVEKYASASRLLKNFVVTPHGAAANRAGTRYGGSTKGDAWAWLLPFAFSDTDTLALVFTVGALRFVSSASGLPGYVESSPGVPYEIATPYAAADLPKLRYAQVGNVIRLACKGYDLYELTRTSASPLAFTFAPVSFDVPPCPVNGGINGPKLSFNYADNAANASNAQKQWEWRITALCESLDGLTSWETTPVPVLEMLATDVDTWDVAVAHDSGWLRNYAGHTYISLQAANTGNQPDISPTWWELLQVRNASSYWRFSLPDAKSTISWSYPAPTTFRIVAWLLYRGREEVFGYVNRVVPISGATSAGFRDYGDDAPDFSFSPPQGKNPLQVKDANGALVRTEKPAVVAYQEQRCILATTDERPGFVFLSAVNAYSNFDDHVEIIAEDGFSRELAAVKLEEIRALVPGRVLMAFSNTAEWAISGAGEGAAISPLSFAARPRTTRGSSWVEPVKVGDDEVLFFPPSGNVVRELALDGSTGKYSAPDVTIFSKHLFAGRQIVDSDWQEEPWSVLWVVLDDGMLLSFSYVAEHQLRAWAWHDTQGAVESVCCVREGPEDALYLSVRRTVNGQTKRFIERMDSRATITGARRGLFLDAAVSYDGAPATHFAGLDHLEGCTVNALADGNVVRDLVVAGGAVDLPAESFPDGASVVLVGLPYVSELETLDVIPGKGRERVKTVSHVIFEFEGSRGGYVGQALDKKLEEFRQRTVAMSYGAIPLESGDVKIAIASSWNSGGRAVVQQVDPLPLTITAVVREVEFGG